MNRDGLKIYSVKELNSEIKSILEDSYPDIWLEGEVSNFKIYPSGHSYFSIKDDESQISAVMFNMSGRYLKFSVDNGIRVLVRGKVSSYIKRGDYQIIINHIEPFGKGALQLAFEQLKEKLLKEGLFDENRKKSIPELCSRIGVVTSSEGAALRDILSVLKRRYINVDVLICPAKVQGDDAKYEIVEAIEYLNKNYRGLLDVMLVGRGGGSLEDLWPFNEEMVVRAIAESKIPVISCIGHETDFTLSDFAADLRAPTPSAAAEIAVKNKQEYIDTLKYLQNKLQMNMNTIIESCEQKIKNLRNTRALSKPAEIFEDMIMRMDLIQEKLKNAIKSVFSEKENAVKNIMSSLSLLSPLNILERGYSVCRKMPESMIVKDAETLNVNDAIEIKLYKGNIKAVVTE